MLIVSRQQLAAMNASRLDRFRQLLRAHLRDVLPKAIAGRSDAQVAADIDAGIDAARQFGLVTERDVARYVALAFALGNTFPTEPATAWTAEILHDRTREPGIRIAHLFGRLEPAHPEHAALWEAWRG